MSLQAYRKKRRFDRTPEPRGQPEQGRGSLRFVVQKHQASRLHYDFRLELDGALKSWAVPKGPSLKPTERRLAMMVEDHPLDYRTFEGTIPAGNYGAGTVLLWDQGTYCARGTADRTESERRLREGLRKGHLSFVLSGQKLKGEFSLVRLRHGADNAWLLLKKADPWAGDADVTTDDRSVASGRSLDEIARGASKRRRRGPANQRALPSAALRGTPRAAMPRRVRPMLASLVDEPFDRKGWLFELKWDGYRAIAEVTRQGVSLYSRSHQLFTDRFAPVAQALRDLGHEAVLDGEVVVLDDRGRSHFQLLQNYQRTRQGRLRYCVFDLLYLDGRDLRRLPLRRRKDLLARLVRDLPNVLVSEHVEGQGVALFDAAVAQGLEGIIAKDGGSPYREGVRGDEWLKIKTRRRQEAVICGFTEPRGSRRDLGALVLGVYEGDRLVYIGHTGGGFDTRGRAEMRARLTPLVRSQCPFAKRPATNAPVHWLEPRLVCEVAFQEWTHDGHLRQPIFVGLREDKPARAVRREGPRPVDSIRQTVTRSKGRSERPPAPEEPVLTHLDKVYWPEEGYTKGDLIAYYRDMAPVLLPYLRDRDQSLHRHPNGISGASFFQKDVSRQPRPAWVRTVTVPSESKGQATYVLCQDEASLLYLANLGCIELNPWHARVGSLERPDYLVLDLDPEAISFDRVIEAAQAVHRVLDRAGVPCLCKTSGKRGLHVFVPLGARYDEDQARQFAQLIATLVHQRLPATTSLLRSPARRQGRVYLDYLQNRHTQTIVAPYSARPHPGATVSTPLRWSEVRKGLDPARFTIRTVAKRLDRLGDLWQPVLGAGIDLAACLQRLAP